MLISNVRFSYADVFVAKSINGGPERYSVSILIDKKDKDTIEAVEDAIEDAIEDGAVKWGGKIPKNLKTPLRDGDDERPDDPVYKGKMFLNANSTTKPEVVDENVDPIIEHGEFYSGCYGRVTVNFFAFNSNGSKGIGCGLGNIQKLKDGEKLSGGTTAMQDFGDDAPRKRRRRDEEDEDEPRSSRRSRRRRDEEDEDEPRSSRRSRRRSRRDEEDEDEPRSSRRSRRRSRRDEEDEDNL